MSHKKSIVLTKPQAGELRKPLAVTYVSADKLKPNNNNPRIHSDKQIKQLMRSIEVFGFDMPIAVDRNLQVIVGHGRLQAAMKLGMKKIPVVILEHLSPEQAMALMIADNKLTENSLWDARLLAEQLKLLSEVELDFSLDVISFEMSEIDVMIEGIAPPMEDQNDPRSEERRVGRKC